MATIKCVGKDGVSRDFEVESEEVLTGKKWDFSVRAQESNDFFQLTVETSDDNKVRITQIFHNDDPAYKGMGIPDALLPYVASQLKKQIISSSNKFPSKPGEWRSVYANKMWDRLVGKVQAVYDEQKDVYLLNTL